jgi:hypothetical protein
MYTLILGSKVAKNDENVFDARGVMIHNETTGEYIFGDSGRVLGNDEFGNIMRYNDNTGAVNCDGKVNLGIDFGAVENTATGLITTNVNEDNKYNFDLSLGLNLEFSKDINEKLASLFLQDFENGDLDNSTDKFSKQIKNLMDEKEAKKFFEDLTKNSTATKPKNFNFNLLLSDTKFVFDPAEMTYRSKGPIGMVFYGEKSILKKMDGYIEFGAQRSSGYFNIYLKSSLGDWLFITYKSSNVTFLSSYDDLNALITGVDPEKRKVTRDNGKFYIYALGSQTKMKAFVERMKALNSK